MRYNSHAFEAGDTSKEGSMNSIPVKEQLLREVEKLSPQQQEQLLRVAQ